VALVRIRLDMAQGAAQFCRRSAFDLLKGYGESYFMGKDVDFYWRKKVFSLGSVVCQSSTLVLALSVTEKR
jgi:hypothetical protein